MAEGRLTSGRSKLPDEAVAWVARQVKVPASDIGLFDWEGRTAERLHSVIRKFTGFREFTVADAEKLTAWLAEEVCSRERRDLASARRCWPGCARSGSSSRSPGTGSAGSPGWRCASRKRP